MSDKPISAGDLVIVVLSRCCGYGLGAVLRVSRIRPTHTGILKCGKCKSCISKDELIVEDDEIPAGRVLKAPLSCVKRIDPLSEPEHTETDRELTV